MNPSDRIETKERKHAEYVATMRWGLGNGDFAKGKYSREHTWEFDGGVVVDASPSPHVVPAPWSNPDCVDPEEAFVAAIASCHLLTFLWLASKKGWIATEYIDRAVGVMTKNERGVPWVSLVTLHPNIQWKEGTKPSPEEIVQLHEEAHHECFIANSVRTEIRVHSV